MTLVGAILKKVASLSEYPSPPPEPEELLLRKKRKKRIDKFLHIRPRVDSSPPDYHAPRMYAKLPGYRKRLLQIYFENIELLQDIKRAHFNRGRVDCRWDTPPPRTELYYRKRVDFYKSVHLSNQSLYKRILSTGPRVVTTESLAKDWRDNRRNIVLGAQSKFVLFPPIPQETMEDLAFLAPTGVKRPRVHISLQIKNCAPMGELIVELFTDICPKTCQLFLDLFEGDGLGHGYVDTCFFRKVPHLYWTGGDVIYNNGFGCYAQRGRAVPIGAENFHFSHSMPGLLSMHVTKDDEACGIFNITFKPMPQIDLQNVVFGRVVRPSNLFECIRGFGTLLSTQPIVEIVATRRKIGNRWVYGQPNTKLRMWRA